MSFKKYSTLYTLYSNKESSRMLWCKHYPTTGHQRSHSLARRTDWLERIRNALVLQPVKFWGAQAQLKLQTLLLTRKLQMRLQEKKINAPSEWECITATAVLCSITLCRSLLHVFFSSSSSFSQSLLSPTDTHCLPSSQTSSSLLSRR